MRAGELDRIIQIESLISTPNEYGEVEESWDVLAIVPANKRPLRGEERFMSEQTAGGTEVVFRIRYLSGLDTINRVICEEKEYDITSIIELGRREGLELYCKTRSD